MLSDRRQIVLKMLINEYIAHALPIGSRTLIDRYHLDISSATVRNELSHLEDAGYLRSPHTSSGRIPTDFGYRTFVDDLIAHLPESPDRSLLTRLCDDASELDNLLDRTSQALARFTNCLAIVVPVSLMNVAIKRITLVQITHNRLLAVVVAEDGSVLDVPIETNEQIDHERIARIEEAINAFYTGSTISDPSIEQSNDISLANALTDARKDPLMMLIEQELFDSLSHVQPQRPHMLGISRLLDQPEFSDSTRLSPLIEKLEDDTILFHLFNESDGADIPLVRIGSENSREELTDISVVASPYGSGIQKGMIAIIGPTRMDYQHVIEAVRAARSLLEDEQY